MLYNNDRRRRRVVWEFGYFWFIENNSLPSRGMLRAALVDKTGCNRFFVNSPTEFERKQ